MVVRDFVVLGQAVCPLSRVERLSATRRFQMYGKINRGHGICPLYGGCPLLGESVIRGFTVVYFPHSQFE